MITNLEVATAELKNGIYEVHFGFDENGVPKDDLVTYISEAMLKWYIEDKIDFDPSLFTIERQCEYYLMWYYRCEKVNVTLDVKGNLVNYELIYTVKDSNVLPWLLVDENLNIKEPHTLPIEQQHKVKYEAHFREATKNETLNF